MIRDEHSMMKKDDRVATLFEGRFFDWHDPALHVSLGNHSYYG